MGVEQLSRKNLMKPVGTLSLAVLLAAGPVMAWAGGCPGLGKDVEKDARELAAQMWEDIQASLTAVAEDECKSLVSVVAAAKGKGRGPGRTLEDDQPLDVAAAQAEFAAAMQDAEIRARLEAIRGEVKQENVRLLYEAAVLDAAGKYAARELLVAQVRDRLGKN